MFDLLIKNGLVADGTGKEAFLADVAIENGKISAVADIPIEAAQKTLDAAGRYVTPGFIDIHRHADCAIFREGFGEAELCQGLTTIVNGNCGMSIAPIDIKNAGLTEYIAPILGAPPKGVDISTLSGYLAALDEASLPINCGMLVGSGTLRAGTDADELPKRLERTLASGAFGVSLGLGYAPECFCDTDELIRGLAPLKKSGLPVTVHMRSEGDEVCEAVKEVISIGCALETPIHISHLKAMGARNWNSRIVEALDLIDQAVTEGIDVSCDVYPYTAGSTQLLHILPPEFLEGGVDKIVKRLRDAASRRRIEERITDGTGFDNIAGMVGWDNIRIAALNGAANKSLMGKSISEAASLRGESPIDAVCGILAEERCAVTMIDFITCEHDIERILKYDRSSLISDAIYPVGGQPHPRVFGAFARVLDKYVGQGTISFEQAIHRMTGEPAAVMGIKNKGCIAVGFDADINIFDLSEVHELATYEAPSQPSEGMWRVIVDGQIAVSKGKTTGTVAGKVLRR